MPRLAALLMNRTNRPPVDDVPTVGHGLTVRHDLSVGDGLSVADETSVDDGLVVVPVVPRPRFSGQVELRDRLVISHGADALRLLDVAPAATPRWNPGSLLLGFAVGAVVAGRRRR